MLAQELLEQPKMSNHARGLWGYSGTTPEGHELSVQSTGMGGPSAALVLADLAELGLRRGIRVGTCTALRPEARLGELAIVSDAVVWPRREGIEAAHPDPALTAALTSALGEAARPVVVASLDTLPGDGAGKAAADVADMQTATLLGRGAELGLALAAVLIVAATASDEQLGDGETEEAGKRAGVAARAVLSV
jgi:uridine phosphorylase